MGEVIDGVRYYPSRAAFMARFRQWDATAEDQKEEAHDTPPAYNAQVGMEGATEGSDNAEVPVVSEVPVILAMASKSASRAPSPPSGVDEEDVVLAFAAGVVIGAIVGVAAGRWSAS